jgi:hypothetical protein
VPSLGLPSNDHDFLDSYVLNPVDSSAQFVRMLRELPAGLSEWAIHSGLEDAELLAMEKDGRHIRQRDFDFLMSQEVKDVLQEEGSILLDYRALQEVWKGK